MLTRRSHTPTLAGVTCHPFCRRVSADYSFRLSSGIAVPPSLLVQKRIWNRRDKTHRPPGRAQMRGESAAFLLQAVISRKGWETVS